MAELSLTPSDRLKKADALIAVIASCGRRFFYDSDSGRIAHFELRGWRVFFVDEYTQEAVYTHYPHGWRKFNHGGTMRRLVEALRDYIRHGTLLPRGHFAWPADYCGGDLWDYGAPAMEKVRAAARELGLVATTRKAPETGQPA